MEFVNVIVATVVAFAAGAVWYMKLADQWMDAASIKKGPDGKPEGGENPMLYGFSFLMQLIVAGMMRHVFNLSGIDTFGAGLVAGLGIGLFFIAPWIAINNAYCGRPVKLTMIDGGYATLACAIIGVILVLF